MFVKFFFFFFELLNIMHTFSVHNFHCNLDQLVCGQRPESFNLESSAAYSLKTDYAFFDVMK